MEHSKGKPILSFDVFEADLQTCELRQNGIVVHLQEQPFQVLWTLLEHPGELISREQLRAAVWPDGTFVDFDHALNTAIKKIRHALDDDALAPRFVQTMPRRGYRFLVPVQRSDRAAAAEGASRRVGKAGLRYRWATAAAGLLLAIVIIAGVVWRGKAKMASPPERRITLAVLPVTNLSDDSDLDRLCEHLTEATTARLVALSPERLGVTARSATGELRSSTQAAAEIGHELDVDYIVESSIRYNGDSVRVTSQIVRTSDQSYVWRDYVDGIYGDDQGTEHQVTSAVTAKVEKLLLRNR